MNARQYEMLAHAFAWVVTLLIIVLGVIGLTSVVWLIWIHVLPTAWPTGPTGFTDPNYWTFLAGIAFIVIGRFLIRRK